MTVRSGGDAEPGAVGGGDAGPGPGPEDAPGVAVGPARLAELAERLDRLRARIDAAARAAGRDPAGLRLVAVTKTWPAADVAAVHRLGLRDVGENRDQEAAAKARALTDAGIEGVHWHFLGRLQRNKARSVASYTWLLHSLDRPELLAPLARGAEAAGRVLPVLVQVSLDRLAPHDAAGDRGGLAPERVPALADAVAAEPRLRLCGVMAVAPLGSPARPAFARLREVSARLQVSHPAATVVSAGMSGDLEDAVAEGATLLRVGAALFGKRPPLA